MDTYGDKKNHKFYHFIISNSSSNLMLQSPFFLLQAPNTACFLSTIDIFNFSSTSAAYHNLLIYIHLYESSFLLVFSTTTYESPLFGTKNQEKSGI